MTAGAAQVAPALQPASERKKLPARALVFLALLGAAAAASAAPFLPRLLEGRDLDGVGTFAALCFAAAVSHVFLVKQPGRRAYHSSIIFLVAAALLVRPELLILMGLLTNIPEWLKERPAWYIQTFNILNYTLSTMAAWGAAQLVLRSGVTDGATTRFALAGFAACVAFVALNHLLLPTMVHLARGLSFREGGVLDFEWHSTDLVLAALGVALAAFWDVNPWLIPVALAPLLVVHRSFSVPQLQAEARVDAKTGLFNARHFAAVLNDELGRAQRFERPLSLIVADLDLLRDVNNTYGHLAGDAVLIGVAEVFRRHLRHYDVPARFGGEEFCILLPETEPDDAMEIAERIRRAVAAELFEVETSNEPIRATISMGVASFPRDASDANQIIHEADLAVYRAKLQGRNRVLHASADQLAVPVERAERLIAVPEDGEHTELLPPAPQVKTDPERRHPRPHAVHGPRFLSISVQLATLVSVVGTIGLLAGIAGAIFGESTDLKGLIAVIVLIAVGQALAIEADFDGSISVGAVGALAGAALFGPRAALVLAVATLAIDWSARRQPFHQVYFNLGALCLGSLAAAGVFGIGSMADFGSGVDALVMAVLGVVAGAAYFAANTGLVAVAEAVAGRERLWTAWHERFAWLLPHYLAYGLIAGVIFIGYQTAQLYALAVFAVPLLLMRKTQESYLRHTQKSAVKLRQAAETIQTQNVSLEQANRLLKERSTAAMESLSATVDARDAYTAGHSRRVQRTSLAIGGELGLSQAELDLLGHAALFHDIGKLAIPDAILLKPGKLSEDEWVLMRSHSEEGARIIERLGFLNDAVPAIRHHHERFDGRGYPNGLIGEEIPLGARVIHVADALDSMLTTRIYGAARPREDALTELREHAGSQFCPRCVSALERVFPQVAQEDEQNAHVELRAVV